MSDFYCGGCGRFKDISLRRERLAGKRSICSTCLERCIADASPRMQRRHASINRQTIKKYDRFADWLLKGKV